MDVPNSSQVLQVMDQGEREISVPSHQSSVLRISVLYVNYISIKLGRGRGFQIYSLPIHGIGRERCFCWDSPTIQSFTMGLPLRPHLHHLQKKDSLSVAPFSCTHLFFCHWAYPLDSSLYFLPLRSFSVSGSPKHCYLFLSIETNTCLLHPLKPGTAIGFWQLFFTKWKKLSLFLVLRFTHKESRVL